MDFLNDICLDILLFFFYFALYSVFIPKTAAPITTEEYNPLDEIKRAFSAEFDPEPSPQPEKSAEFDPEPPLQLTVNSYQLSVKETVENELVQAIQLQPVILALPPAKPRRRNQVTVLTLPVLITPPPTQPTQPTQPNNEETEMVPSLQSFSIRQLRSHIREHNLQSLVKDKLGKTVSKCSKSELLMALA